MHSSQHEQHGKIWSVIKLKLSLYKLAEIVSFFLNRTEIRERFLLKNILTFQFTFNMMERFMLSWTSFMREVNIILITLILVTTNSRIYRIYIKITLSKSLDYWLNDETINYNTWTIKLSLNAVNILYLGFDEVFHIAMKSKKAQSFNKFQFFLRNLSRGGKFGFF
jgi:hypothetical protein